MKKIISLIGLSSIIGVSCFAGLSPNNVNNINAFLNSVEKPTSGKPQLFSEVLNAINNNMNIIKMNEMYFSEKTNTITTSRTVIESIFIKEMKNESLNFQKLPDNWVAYKVFNEKNRDLLSDSLLLENCQDLNAFGPTNFVEHFNGTFSGKFTVKYSINQKNCDIVAKKFKMFETSLKKNTPNVNLIGFFNFKN